MTHDETTPTSEAPLPEGDALAAGPERAPEPRDKPLSYLWREWLKPLLLVLLVMGSLRSAVADWNDVPTGSMKPTIIEGDRIFVNKAAYDLRVPFTLKRLAWWGEPEQGDIVVLFSPEDRKRLVKRVVALPGDEIAVRGGRLHINQEPIPYGPIDPGEIEVLEPGEQATYSFANEGIGGEAGHSIMLAPGRTQHDDYGPVLVPEGSFFVMGDNRKRSRDSRVFGFVERRLIVGRARRVVLSLDFEDKYLFLPKPRWDRFFHRLL